MTPPFSLRKKQLVENHFSAHHVADAVKRLEQDCGKMIPFYEDADKFQMERVRFAVIKFSEGQINIIINAITEARFDWRNLSMATGFGHDVNAHENGQRKSWKNETPTSYLS